MPKTPGKGLNKQQPVKKRTSLDFVEQAIDEWQMEGELVVALKPATFREIFGKAPFGTSKAGKDSPAPKEYGAERIGGTEEKPEYKSHLKTVFGTGETIKGKPVFLCTKMSSEIHVGAKFWNELVYSDTLLQRRVTDKIEKNNANK